ncbi:hypothetical protein [Saccharomonospora iraqiensis]|uniref:hypothetical protein n=1 Tax=Saccharomonospora iraqiensis TaxID=52698 RepID=UPI00022E007D|nr:hypothetical protein [Saccharomonospora iraqiensis]
MTTGNAGHSSDLPRPLDGPALAEELARQKDVQPIHSIDDLACDGIFDTDEELDEFLEFTYAARRTDLA